MSVFGLHPTLDRFSTINEAAINRGLQLFLAEKLGKIMLSSFEPWNESKDHVSRLDLLDASGLAGWHFAFAPPEGEDNPMHVTQLDDETFESLHQAVLARVTVYSVEPLKIKVGPQELAIRSYMANVTEDTTIISAANSEISLDPFIGEFDSKEYQAADEILVQTTPIEELTEIAKILR